jgi:hypothetical protein
MGQARREITMHWYTYIVCAAAYGLIALGVWHLMRENR